jgi:hypothetical protein
MARYRSEFGERAVVRPPRPEGVDISRMSGEFRVAVATLERWRAEALISAASMHEARRDAWRREEGISTMDLIA